MLQGEHSAILLTSIKLPFVNKVFVLSIFVLPFYTGFTAHVNINCIYTADFLHWAQYYIKFGLFNIINAHVLVCTYLSYEC